MLKNAEISVKYNSVQKISKVVFSKLLQNPGNDDDEDRATPLLKEQQKK